MCIINSAFHLYCWSTHLITHFGNFLRTVTVFLKSCRPPSIFLIWCYAMRANVSSCTNTTYSVGLDELLLFQSKAIIPCRTAWDPPSHPVSLALSFYIFLLFPAHARAHTYTQHTQMHSKSSKPTALPGCWNLFGQCYLWSASGPPAPLLGSLYFIASPQPLMLGLATMREYCSSLNLLV